MKDATGLFVLAALTLLCLANSYAPKCPPPLSSPWTISNWKSLVAFGDSYTDENRLLYFVGHHGEEEVLNRRPPPGFFGHKPLYRPWARQVVQYTANDSFMWMDELHPSGQVHRVLGREIVKTLDGRSGYATYWRNVVLDIHKTASM